MGERRAIPEQGAIDVRSGAHVFQQTGIADDEPRVEPVRVPVAATRRAVVQGDIHAPRIAPKHGESLRRKVHGLRRMLLARGEPHGRAKQRLPPQIRSRQARCGHVVLGFGGRAIAPGRERGGIAGVQSPERRGQPRITVARQPQLARLGKAPLPERHPVLRVAPRRKGEVGECGQERRDKPFGEAREARFRKRNA